MDFQVWKTQHLPHNRNAGFGWPSVSNQIPSSSLIMEWFGFHLPPAFHKSRLLYALSNPEQFQGWGSLASLGKPCQGLPTLLGKGFFPISCLIFPFFLFEPLLLILSFQFLMKDPSLILEILETGVSEENSLGQDEDGEELPPV